MKVVVVDYFDIFDQGLSDRFKNISPSEQRLRCTSPSRPVDILSQRYWLQLDDPLATECLLRGIGTVKDITEKTYD
jgi:hypothetical protein